MPKKTHWWWDPRPRAALASTEREGPRRSAGRSPSTAGRADALIRGGATPEESGLYYHGARYYAAWLGRWTAVDPAGLVDGLNLYRYSRDNSINFSDPSGTESLSLMQRAALWADDKINASPVARGIVKNLGDRGEALVKSGGALREKYKSDGVGGVLSAVTEGVVHTAKDTAAAAVDVGYYGAKAVVEGDSAALEKAASRGVDVVLGTADTVAVFGGVGSAAATGGKLATTAAETVANTLPRLAPAAGFVSGGGGALAATGGVAPAVIAAGGATIVAMKNQGEGEATPGAQSALEGGRGTAARRTEAGPQKTIESHASSSEPKVDVGVDATKGVKALKAQAADLVRLNKGKARVTIDSPSQRMEVDLTGKAHGGVETPHTKVSPRNPEAPASVQPAYNTRKAPTVDATQQDIRTVRKYLERQGN